jgi:uncharacterized protein (DUF433 family)
MHQNGIDEALRSHHVEPEPDERSGVHPWQRLTVRRVVEAVALSANRDDLFRNYPELETDDIRQALAFAAANLEDSASESNAA